jgi:hypothetical protein
MSPIARMPGRAGLAALVLLAALGGARAGGHASTQGHGPAEARIENLSPVRTDEPFWDELTRYAERIDTVSVVSGDAQDVNAAVQTIDPWPPYARDRRIPISGQRLVGAVNRYQNPTAPGAQPPTTLAPVMPIGGGGGGGGGGGQ